MQRIVAKQIRQRGPDEFGGLLCMFDHYTGKKEL